MYSDECNKDTKMRRPSATSHTVLHFYYFYIMAEGEAAMNAASRILNSLAVKSFFSRFYDNQPTACKLKNRNTQCIPA